MQPAFLPQHQLSPDQYHCNFQQIDNHSIRLLNSPEARKVTPHMSGIYLMLKAAPWDFWERQGALRVVGDSGHTAWEVLCEMTGVASATLRKAIKWMNEQGLIRYKAWKNGHGIRILFNLAASSVRKLRNQKNLRLVHTSSGDSPTSSDEVALYEHDLDNRDIENAGKPARSTTPAKVILKSPPATSPPDQLRFVEARVSSIEQRLNQVINAIPDREWLLDKLGPKLARVAAQTVLRNLPARSTTAMVGHSQPQSDVDPDFRAIDELPPRDYQDLLNFVTRSNLELHLETWPSDQAKQFIRIGMLETLREGKWKSST